VHGFAPDALEALTTSAWPGNVRQLYNVVEHVCALATAPLVPLSLVQRAARAVAGSAELHGRAAASSATTWQLLKLTDGSVADAARLAERNRTEFYRLLQKHELDASLFRGDVAIERQDETPKINDLARRHARVAVSRQIPPIQHWKEKCKSLNIKENSWHAVCKEVGTLN
jgi:two-component system response regulator GlrR